jgi:hypothetical protein
LQEAREQKHCLFEQQQNLVEQQRDLLKRKQVIKWFGFCHGSLKLQDGTRKTRTPFKKHLVGGELVCQNPK